VDVDGLLEPLPLLFALPLSQAAILDMWPPSAIPGVMAIWSAVTMVAPILGPTFGGFLTENLNWRWVFYINLPIGVLTFVGLYFTLPENRNTQGSKFDFFGFTTLSIFITALQLMMDRGQLLDWFSSREIMTESGISRVTVNDSESPLAWLARRKGRDGRTMIGHAQFIAGEKLRAAFADNAGQASLKVVK